MSQDARNFTLCLCLSLSLYLSISLSIPITHSVARSDCYPQLNWSQLAGFLLSKSKSNTQTRHMDLEWSLVAVVVVGGARVGVEVEIRTYFARQVVSGWLEAYETR